LTPTTSRSGSPSSRGHDRLVQYILEALQVHIASNGTPPPGTVDAERLHNAFASVIGDLQPSVETLTYVLAMLQYEVLTAKFTELMKE
jgi:hypothetical protein